MPEGRLRMSFRGPDPEGDGSEDGAVQETHSGVTVTMRNYFPEKGSRGCAAASAVSSVIRATLCGSYFRTCGLLRKPPGPRGSHFDV